jgi:hypothetical protein
MTTESEDIIECDSIAFRGTECVETIPDNNEPVITEQVVKQRYSNVVSDNDELKQSAYNDIIESSPLFYYMFNNKTATSIPATVRRYSHISSKTDKITPLMFACILNNIYFVNDMLVYCVGKIDKYHKTALEYARLSNADVRIIELLREFETPRTREFKNKSV